MSYIAFELDALNLCANVARSAGCQEETVISGLVRMWAWCFRTKKDTVNGHHLTGFFGQDISGSLIAFEFIEKFDSCEFRVRGASRYLKIRESQQLAAKHTNALKKKKIDGERTVDRAVGRAENDALRPTVDRTVDRAENDALTPNTEHLIKKNNYLVGLGADADRVFDFWKATRKNPETSKFGDKRKKAVLARLREGYTVEQLCAAVSGCMVTPHNQGENERGEKYDDLELICRDAVHVDRFAANAKNPPKPRYKNSGRANGAETDWTKPQPELF